MSHVAFEAEVAARAEIPRTGGAHEFEQSFRALPQAEAQAPGRIHLLGDYAEVNDGYVLTVAIPQQARVAMRRNGGSQFELHASDLKLSASFTLEAPPEDHFASYVYGCLRLARAEGAEIPPLDIQVSSDIPRGMGLAAGAALEVAGFRCLRELLQLQLDDMRIAQLAQQAQIQDAGVRCGLVDAVAASLGSPDEMLLLDARSLVHRRLPLPRGSALLVLDPGLGRDLAASGALQRRAECEDAAQRLGVASLRDIGTPERIEALPDLPRRRARHACSENARVLQALACADDAQAFGALMNASHASLRDDFEVSTPELDALVGLLQRHPAVFGARLTGAGFGGACVALCRAEAVQDVAHAVLGQYADSGHRGRMLVPAAGRIA